MQEIQIYETNNEKLIWGRQFYNQNNNEHIRK